MGAGEKGVARPLQTVRAGLLVCFAESPFDDADSLNGFFDDDARNHSVLPHFSDQCVASLDFLFAVALLCGGLDCHEWRPTEESLCCKIGLSNCGRLVKYDQFPLIFGASRPFAPGISVSVSPDMVLPRGSASKSYLVYSRLQFFLCDGERIFPRYGSHTSGVTFCLVLSLPHYLLVGFRSNTLSNLIPSQSDGVSAQWLPFGDLLRSASDAPVDGFIFTRRFRNVSNRLSPVPPL